MALGAAVGEEDDFALLAVFEDAHFHFGEAHGVVAKDGADSAEGVGLVFDDHADVVARDEPVHVGELEGLGTEGEGRAGAVGGHGSADIEEVADDGAGGGIAARAAPAEHEIADEVSAQVEGVVDVIYGGDGLFEGDEGGVNADADLVGAGFFGDAKEFDFVAEDLGEMELAGADVADAFAVSLGEVYGAAKGDAGEDGRFVEGVESVHVVGGVGFGVAGGLSFGEGVFEAGPALAHAGEDDVGGSVEDSAELEDVVAGELVFEGLDDGDTSADSGFVVEIEAEALGEGEEAIAVLGDHLFVGGDDGFAVPESGFDEFGGGVETADDLNDHVNVGIGDDAVEVGGEEGGFGGTLFGGVADTDPGDFEGYAGFSGEGGGVVEEHPVCAVSDGAETQEPDPKRARRGGALNRCGRGHLRDSRGSRC